MLTHSLWQLGALSTTQLAIIKNAELLAFSQDNVYGKPAKPYKTGTNPPEFYSGTSSLGIHVFVINLASSAASKVRLQGFGILVEHLWNLVSTTGYHVQ